jgi:hypothetical protein
MKKPKPIRSVLEDTLQALGIDAPIKNYSLFHAWKEIVGETIALQTQPRSLRNQILFVDVSHSTWIQQLQFLKPQLLEKLNAFLGEQPIRDIRFKLGKISPPSPLSSPSSVWSRELLDKRTLDRMDELLGEIEDKEMREGLRNILVKGAKLERHRRKAK